MNPRLGVDPAVGQRWVALWASLSLLLGACAVTEQTPQAQQVRIISADQAKHCKFIDTISANNTNTLSKNPEEDARNRALNRVAERGGNALKIITTNTQVAPSGLGSIFSLSGEAYLCVGKAMTEPVRSSPSTPPPPSSPPASEESKAKLPVTAPPPPAMVPAERPQTAATESRTYARDLVLKLQQRLKVLGYDVGVPDGNWGPRSRAALIKFQKAKGLAATGEPATELLAAMGGEVQGATPPAPPPAASAPRPIRNSEL